MIKSSPSNRHLLHNVKSTVKISSIFVAFLDNMNFNGNKNKSMESVQYEIAYYRSRSKIFENNLTLLQ